MSNTDFFSFLAALIRKIPKNNRGLGMVKALPFIHQPDRVVRKASDVSAADWLYQTHVKIYRIFSRVLFRLFRLRAGNPCITPKFMGRSFVKINHHRVR